MDLERLSLRLRPRSDWEAVDLGLAMVRTWWKSVYRVWLVLMLPLAMALTFGLGTWGWVIFWWLLPIGQVAVLKTLSQRVFGRSPGFKETLRALPGLWWRGRAEFGLRRFHPARSFRLAVGQLEGLAGQERRQRHLVLGSQGQESPGGLPLIFLLFEFGWAMALITFMLWMVPDGFGFDGELFTDRFMNGNSPPWVYRGFWAFVAISVLLVDPLYVGAGFALYLNRRTQLEGWDLEIAFRRLANRLDTPSMPRSGSESLATPMPIRESSVSLVPEPEPGGDSQRRSGTLGASILLTSCLLLPGGWVDAQETTSAERPRVELEEPLFDSEWTNEEARDPRQVIARVMQRSELRREKTTIRWRLREGLFEDREKKVKTSGSDLDLSWLETLSKLIASLLEPILWLSAMIVMFWIFRALWRSLPDEASESSGGSLPERILGLALKPDSLPENVAQIAEKLWREGQPVAALSLLYRGALSRLVQEGLALRESFTEKDCLQEARQSLAKPRADFFADLTRIWQLVAYGHRLPEEVQASRLWILWDLHFGDGTRGVHPEGAE